jgi:WD40 repeat protein
MGNCLPFFKALQNKYSENLETPPVRSKSIELACQDYISCLAVCSGNNWAVSQESTMSLYSDFNRIESWKLQERARCICNYKNLLLVGGKTIEVFDFAGKVQGKLIGHERPISALDQAGQLLLSGSPDWSMRLWDLEKDQQLDKNVLNWNSITCIKWIDQNTAVQTSEDLKIRVADIRLNKIRYVSVINVGDNFATCCDVKDNFFLTGHRGFSGNGCDVKLWDIRKNAEVISTKAHDMPVEAVKFHSEFFYSCAKDGKVVCYQNDGIVSDTWTHSTSKPFIAMDRYKDGLILANIEPKVLFFTLNPLKTQF